MRATREARQVSSSATPAHSSGHRQLLAALQRRLPALGPAPHACLPALPPSPQRPRLPGPAGVQCLPGGPPEGERSGRQRAPALSHAAPALSHRRCSGPCRLQLTVAHPLAPPPLFCRRTCRCRAPRWRSRSSTCRCARPPEQEAHTARTTAASVGGCCSPALWSPCRRTGVLQAATNERLLSILVVPPPRPEPNTMPPCTTPPPNLHLPAPALVCRTLHFSLHTYLSPPNHTLHG